MAKKLIDTTGLKAAIAKIKAGEVKYVKGEGTRSVAVSYIYNTTSYGGANGLAKWAFGASSRDTENGYIGVVRSSQASLGIKGYSTMAFFGAGDTHFFIGADYNETNVRVGAGNRDGLVWNKVLAFKDDLTKTLAVEAVETKSDARLKENVADVTDDEADRAARVRVVDYNFNGDARRRCGVIAQEVEAAGLGRLVGEDEGGMKTVDYTGLLMLKVAALERETARLRELLRQTGLSADGQTSRQVTSGQADEGRK